MRDKLVIASWAEGVPIESDVRVLIWWDHTFLSHFHCLKPLPQMMNYHRGRKIPKMLWLSLCYVGIKRTWNRNEIVHLHKIKAAPTCSLWVREPLFAFWVCCRCTACGQKFLVYRTWHPPDTYIMWHIFLLYYVPFIVYNKMPFCWTLKSYTGKWIIHLKHAFIWPSAFLYCCCIWKYLPWGSEQITELRLYFSKVLPRTERDESGHWILIFITEDLNSLGMHESIVIYVIYLPKLDSSER